MSNLAILGARNSVKRSVCGIEAPVRKLIFRTRTIEGLELVPEPGDRQRHFKDLIALCLYSVEYYPGKANVVADALSRKPRGALAALVFEDWKNSVAIGDYNLQYFENEDVAYLSNIVISPSLLQTVQQSQWQDRELRTTWNRLQK
ncbi:hypothetical protein PanWU01x14_099600, partial [Parasponia andersonii]